MRLAMLVGLVVIALALIACGGGSNGSVKYAPTVVPIHHVDLSEVDLGVEQFQHPPVADQYPAVVATVNGQPVTGEELAREEVSLELKKRSYANTSAELPDPLFATREAKVAATDPLEAAIQELLQQQAIQRLGLAPTHEEAVAYTEQQEASTHKAMAQADPERRAQEIEVLHQQGFPESNWAGSDVVVDSYSSVLAISKLEGQYCTTKRPAPQASTPNANPILGIANVSADSSCAGFLANERRHADIVYYVRWVD